MRILIVTESISKTATGIVSQRLIEGLSKKCELHILTGDNRQNCFAEERNIYYSKKKNHNPYMVLISFLLFRNNIFERSWGKEHISSMPIFDLVVSCVSYGHYAALIASNNICKIQHCKHVTYFVDAIPTPNEYVGNNSYLRLMDNPLRNFIRKQTKNISIVYSTCLEMSEYQKSIINNNRIIFDELLNPVPNDCLVYLPKPKTPIFVFAGQVYPPRTPHYVLEAFNSLVQEYPNAELHFLGTKYIKPYLSKYRETTLNKIRIFDFVDDIKNVYINACGLIDIGCDVENDIFMSSKLSGYISYNRPIICETSLKSASRRIFKNDESVFLCEHDTTQILESMRQCVIKMGEFEFMERIRILKNFSVDCVTKKIIQDYRKYFTQL